MGVCRHTAASHTGLGGDLAGGGAHRSAPGCGWPAGRCRPATESEGPRRRRLQLEWRGRTRSLVWMDSDPPGCRKDSPRNGREWPWPDCWLRDLLILRRVLGGHSWRSGWRFLEGDPLAKVGCSTGPVLRSVPWIDAGKGFSDDCHSTESRYWSLYCAGCFQVVVQQRVSCCPPAIGAM
jgi:hypothetical protein